MSDRYVCIHGHFYQPPRENPWLEAVERQDSAAPYHDWNERITRECYARNAASRILDEAGLITRIGNNYGRISFNFGPTLLAWLERHEPETYAAVLEADAESAERFSGHGSAMAQPYNHMILPLANERDRRTQVEWGIRDFEHRFGRPPEGMWLPETAVDLPTLETLAAADIRFTVLSPHQAKRVRPFGGGEWREVGRARVDTTRAYRQRLPSGRTIDLFFYDGPISRAIAFEKLLADGARLADRLAAAVPPGDGARLAHVATDGETYGHHHPFGEMALAFALQQLDDAPEVRLTNYAEFLARHPPTREVEIAENTSWSCGHGVERWRSDCGCATGTHPGWSQAWRAPLRRGLDELRNELAPLFEREASGLLRDPWSARDEYVEVVLQRTPARRDEFLRWHASHELEPGEWERALELLELQRHAMLMYTSCGWFFDDIGGIEARQVLRYAGRAVELGSRLFDRQIGRGLLEELARARSNDPARGDGRAIYEAELAEARADLAKVAAHFAVTSLFDPPAERARIYCFDVRVEGWRQSEAGAARFANGDLAVTSEVTCESGRFAFAVLHMGSHNLVGGVRPASAAGSDPRPEREVREAFDRADFPRAVRLLDEHFSAGRYSLKSLFRDDQRRILRSILDANLARHESLFREVYQEDAGLMRFLTDVGMPQPHAFRMVAEYVLGARLRVALESDAPVDRVRELREEARRAGVVLDPDELVYSLQASLERTAEALAEDPLSVAHLDRLDERVQLARELSGEVDLWRIQNRFWELLRGVYPSRVRHAERGDPAAAAWVESFHALGERLRVAV